MNDPAATAHPRQHTPGNGRNACVGYDPACWRCIEHRNLP